MKKVYTYNPRTCKLHIAGYCKDATGCDYEQFASEEEAISAHAGQVVFCKICRRKVESLIQKDKQ